MAALGPRHCTQAFSLVVVCGLLIAAACRIAEHGPWSMWASVFATYGLSSCDFWALGHRLSRCGARALLIPWHVGSSRVRDQTCVPRVGRQTLHH